MMKLSTILRFTTMTQGAAGARRRSVVGRLGLLLLLLVFMGERAAFADGGYLPVIIADFNHDGIPDVLIPSVNSPTATVSLGTLPGGSFNGASRAVTLPAVCTQAAQGSMVVGDFNGDGLSDIAFFCGSSGGIGGVLLSNGDGTFATAKTFGGIYSTTGVVGDFDHDGKLDLAVLGPNSLSSAQGIQFLHGNGDGTFAAAVFTAFAQGAAYSFPVAVDVNNDGYPDIVAGSFGDGAPTLNVFGNNKNGTFGTLSQGVTSASVSAGVGTQGESTDGQILVGNFFAASGVDFAVPDTGSTPGFFLIKNTSSGTTFALGTPAKTAFPSLKGGGVGSFTGSGFSDLVAADGANLTVLVNDGAGNFSGSYTSLTAGSAATMLAIADANGDGYSDIYTAAGDVGFISTLVKLVNGSATATSQPVSLSVGTKAIASAWTGDVNFSGSTATGTVTVNGSPALLGLSSSKNPSKAGDLVTFTVVATAAQGTTLPTGAISLFDGTTQIATGTLDGSGGFSAMISSLTVGTHQIQAVYAGDNYFAGLSSGVLAQVVNQAMQILPTINWATPDPITYGTPLSSVQLNATAVDANGVTVPGTFVYTHPVGTILDAGLLPLAVTFTPTDQVTYGMVSKTNQLTILQASSSISLTSVVNGAAATTAAYGTVIQLQADVQPLGTLVFPGQVNFCDASAAQCTGLHLLGSAQLNARGRAVLRFVPGIGMHSYKAVFVGTYDVAGTASAAGVLAVTGTYNTTSTLTQSGSIGNYSLTATVTGVGGGAGPGGAVSFVDSSSANQVLGSSSLGSNILSVSFAAPSTLTTGSQPVFVVAADLNGDGKQDLVTADAFSNSLTILLGNGDGTFTAAPKPVTGGYPDYVAVGDFNRDGKPDLAVSDYYGSTVTILLGVGDGTFTAGPTLTAGVNLRALATGDFDGDGNLDLAVAMDNSVVIFLGKGDGTFTQGEQFATAAGPNYSIVVADFNEDGKLDLATTNAAANTVSILFGNGNGTFTTATSQATGAGPNSLVVGDFNGDGHADLATTNGTASSVTILLGKGDGTFTTAPNPAVGDSPRAGAVGDFDGDGKMDLVIANSNGNTFTLLLSNGDGTFRAVTSPATGLLPAWIAAADFDGDGVPDVATINLTDKTISMFRTQATQTSQATVTGVSAIGTGMHQVVASYAGNGTYGASVSTPVSLAAQTLTPNVTWTPAVSTIVYGTPLGGQELNAVATDTTGGALAGAFVYSPAAGTVLGVGTQMLSVTFTPADARYASATSSVRITVTKATPTLTWAAPAGIPYGTALSGAQLNASAMGVGAGALPGTFTYSPAAGTVPAPGTLMLSVTFAPADAIDYTTAMGSVSIVVSPLTLTSFTPNVARVGDPNTTLTLTGSGFVASSVVLVNGAAVATTYVSPTVLTAVVPSADFAKVGTLQVAVSDPSISAVSSAQTLTVTPATPAVTLTGPTTTSPGSQPSVTLTITNPYPVPLTASFNLLFAAAVTPVVDDPAIQFANGGRNFTFTVPANSVTVPAIQLQAGTVAGTITVPLTLTAQGVDVTPTNLTPVTIVVPKAIPMVSTTTLTRNGTALSVAIHGFSNTREVTTATFHFTAAPGATINTPDVTATVAPLFTTWFDSMTSVPYGSTFTYTQVFDVSDDAANIGSVQVTLTNSVGVSASQTAQ